LDNAIKYLDSGNEVVVGFKANEAEATIIVADNGPGIPVESLPRVFERFFQVEAAQDGMGLGLALAKELVESHEGIITVESDSAKGCCFRITLPKENGS
jgi:two-component system phosphate regulon sensor histidine kinase PhoR